MTTATLSIQFFSASLKFHQARRAYEETREGLKVLEQQLLRYTESSQVVPDQAEYIGEGTWRPFGHTITALKYANCENGWKYFAYIGGKPFAFTKFCEAAAFLNGVQVAEGRWEEQEGDATDLTVAT